MIRALNIHLQRPLMQNNAHSLRVRPDTLNRRHECDNPGIGPIFGVAGLIVMMTVACILTVYWSMVQRVKTRSLQPAASKLDDVLVAPNTALLERFPSPHLQVNPSEDLKTFRAGEQAELNSYGWVNRTEGVVRVPIERAIEMLLERGLPVRSSNSLPRAGESSEQLIRKRGEER
jgi:hypothetical protein